MEETFKTCDEDKKPMSLLNDSNEAAKENLFLLNYQISNLRNSFLSVNLPSFGDLFSSNICEVEKTVSCLSEVLLNRHREIQAKSEFLDNLRRHESEISYLKTQNDRHISNRNQLEKELKLALNKQSLLEKSFKESLEKLNYERDELVKQVSKLQSREAQFIHELRKKDQLFSSLQEQLKRSQKEKNVNFINNLGSGAGLGNPSQSKDEGYGFEGFQRLAVENEKIAGFLLESHKSLREIFATRKESLLRIYSIGNRNGQNEGLILNLRKYELLDLEDAVFKVARFRRLEEILEVMSENLKRLRQFFIVFTDNGNENELFLGGEDKDFETQLSKVKESKELRSIIRNYKFLAENQEDLLNSIVFLKSDFGGKTAGKSLGKGLISEEKTLGKIKEEIEEKRQFLVDLEKNENGRKSKDSLPPKGFQEEKALGMGEKENYCDYLNLVV